MAHCAIMRARGLRGRFQPPGPVSGALRAFWRVLSRFKAFWALRPNADTFCTPKSLQTPFSCAVFGCPYVAFRPECPRLRFGCRISGFGHPARPKQGIWLHTFRVLVTRFGIPGFGCLDVSESSYALDASRRFEETRGAVFSLPSYDQDSNGRAARRIRREIFPTRSALAIFEPEILPAKPRASPQAHAARRRFRLRAYHVCTVWPEPPLACRIRIFRAGTSGSPALVRARLPRLLPRFRASPNAKLPYRFRKMQSDAPRIPSAPCAQRVPRRPSQSLPRHFRGPLS